MIIFKSGIIIFRALGVVGITGMPRRLEMPYATQWKGTLRVWHGGAGVSSRRRAGKRALGWRGGRRGRRVVGHLCVYCLGRFLFSRFLSQGVDLVSACVSCCSASARNREPASEREREMENNDDVRHATVAHTRFCSINRCGRLTSFAVSVVLHRVRLATPGSSRAIRPSLLLLLARLLPPPS